MSEQRSENIYGHFGNLIKNYKKARKGFPDEVISYILFKLKIKKPYILDLGCGTGIATRQLHEREAIIVGADIDQKMIEVAEEDNICGIEYIVAPAESLPFKDRVFDAVTAFSAFHWFTSKKALGEIRRVLKKDGFFFIVNKNEAGDFKKEYKAILSKYIDQELPDIKKDYNPKRILEENGFKNIEAKEFSISEICSVDEALSYIQSVSLWNLIPKSKKEQAVIDLLSYLLRIADRSGKVCRKLIVCILVASDN
jgi:ubiquinone/menaquinone biosynthesis C-methylase UbiE